MTALDLFLHLTTAGCQLTRQGDTLRVHDPQHVLTDALRQQIREQGIRLRRDSWVSVMYAEGLNSTKSSGSLQRTDRHGILGQKSSDFQLFL